MLFLQCDFQSCGKQNYCTSATTKPTNKRATHNKLVNREYTYLSRTMIEVIIYSKLVNSPSVSKGYYDVSILDLGSRCGMGLILLS